MKKHPLDFGYGYSILPKIETAGRDFIDELNELQDFTEMPGQQVTVNFPFVSEHEQLIAYEAYFQLCMKYGVTPEDTGNIANAMLLILTRNLSHICGVAELGDEEVAAKVKWQ